MKERSEFVCPRESNQCTHCELIARRAFIDTFDYYSEGNNSLERLEVLADDAKLRAKLEEKTEELTCARRQQLAFMVGHEAGQRMGAIEAGRKHGFKEEQEDE